MIAPTSWLTYFLLLLCQFWAAPASAEPVQYCKLAPHDRPNEEVNFCLGALMYQNASTDSHDMYLTFTFRRQEGHALGWTAVGPGTIMQGSIMFIVYGDPLSHESPIVSIRTTAG